jgi:hypothetical protein
VAHRGSRWLGLAETGAQEANRLLKNDIAYGLTVSPPNRDKLTMRKNLLKTHPELVEGWSQDFMLFQPPARGAQ